jgi:hypothetical protein
MSGLSGHGSETAFAMRMLCSAIAITLCLAWGAPAAAGDKAPPPSEDPEQLLQQSVDTFMRALDALIRSIPQYEMPEINEHGDIIIRRKNPPPFGHEAEPKKQPKPGPAPEDDDADEPLGETDI